MLLRYMAHVTNGINSKIKYCKRLSQVAKYVHKYGRGVMQTRHGEHYVQQLETFC